MLCSRPYEEERELSFNCPTKNLKSLLDSLQEPTLHSELTYPVWPDWAICHRLGFLSGSFVPYLSAEPFLLYVWPKLIVYQAWLKISTSGVPFGQSLPWLGDFSPSHLVTLMQSSAIESQSRITVASLLNSVKRRWKLEILYSTDR